MGNMESYKANCNYIRKNFGLNESTDLYTIVNMITEAYKDLKDKETIVELNEEANLKQEKKRGRPRKSDSN